MKDQEEGEEDSEGLETGYEENTDTSDAENEMIDGDGDGSPDMGGSPQNQTGFYKTPPFDPLALLIQNVTFENGKIFSPSLDEKIYFEIQTNRGTEFNVKIFDD